MKRKISSLILAIAVILSLNMPAFAACDVPCGSCDAYALLWLLRQCGDCSGAREMPLDANMLLHQWLTGAHTGNGMADALEPSAKPEESNTKPDTSTQPPAPEPKPKPEQPAPEVSDIPAESAGTSVHAYEREVVRLVNAERAKYGLSALREDERLCAVARMKSQDMHDLGYFDHNSPTYGTPFQLMKAQGITYRTAGENIAMGYRTPEAVVSAWMASSGHRANILNASYTTIGVGYVADGHYWTQHFTG